MNKTVLITGASSGIGYETAFEFAEKGFNLVLVARRQEKLENLKTEIQNKYDVKVEVIVLNLSQNNSAENLFSVVKNKGFDVDILINNAGFGIKGEFITSEILKNEEMIILNILTLTKLTKLFGQEMKDKKSGTIINIASTAAFQAVPNLGAYSATKAYVLSFTEALAFEMKKYNVNVIAICPGATESEFAKVAGFNDSGVSNSSLPTSKDLANFIFKSTEKKCPVAIHGFKNKLMIFLQRFTPRTLVTKIAGGMIK